MKREPPRGEHGNFWGDWRQFRKRKHFGGKPWDAPMPPDMIHFWREFFHHRMGVFPEEHWAFGGRRFSPWHQGVHTFNPFVANSLSKGGGLLPLYVLQVLAHKPRYGNEIMALLEERTGGQWVANPGAIYPLMNMLEKLGFVQGDWEDPQKRTIRIYRLTSTGKEELIALKEIVQPKLEEAVEIFQRIIADLKDKGSGSADDPGEST